KYSLKKISTGATSRSSGEKRQRTPGHAPGDPSNKPSGVTANQSVPLMETRLTSSCPFERSQSLSCPSFAAETSRLFDVKSSAPTPFLCPDNVKSSLPVFASQSLIPPAASPLANRSPSALKAIAVTVSSWPASRCNSCPVATSQKITTALKF